MYRTPTQLADPTLTWHKSSRSGAAGHCVEAASTPTGDVVVRNSNHRTDGGIAFTHAEWAAFLAGVKAGDFDTL